MSTLRYPSELRICGAVARNAGIVTVIEARRGKPLLLPEPPQQVRALGAAVIARLMEREGTQQLTVVAHYTDGSTQDVTRTTQFDSNDAEMAEVAVTGLVKTGQLTGGVAVMARYQGHVGVFRATIPLGLPVENLPKPKGFLDELVFAKLKALGLPRRTCAMTPPSFAA